MFKIPNITEANEIVENMSQSQAMALYYVSRDITNKQQYNQDEVIVWRRAKVLSHLV